MTSRPSPRLIGSVLALTAALGAYCYAQPGRRLESAPDRSLITVIRVKPEMLSEWLELQRKAVVPALKKAGLTSRIVYTSPAFGTAFEYMIVQPMKKFGDFDLAESRAEALGSVVDAALAERLRKCVISTSSFLSTALPDLSNPPENSNPPVIQFLRLRIAPGKMEEYQALYKTEVVPALKKANANVIVASRRLGTDGYDLTFETALTKFADLDAPPALFRALGPQGVANLTAKLNDLAIVMENTILVREGDLSF